MEPHCLRFFVAGEPLPFPKKLTNRNTGMLYCRDPKGFKRGWMEAVRAAGIKAMAESGRDPWGENEPVAVRYIFYLTRPKSAKKQSLPYRKPDIDNLAYSISNALTGVCYWDDSRIVGQFIEKRFAGNAGYLTNIYGHTIPDGPGVAIEIRGMNEGDSE